MGISATLTHDPKTHSILCILFSYLLDLTFFGLILFFTFPDLFYVRQRLDMPALLHV